jgi:uncharacterized membrane protein
MATMQNEVVIDAPVEKIFAYLNCPSNLPLIWPSLFEIKNEIPLTNGGHSFRWTYKMGGLPFTGTGECIVMTPNLLLVYQINGILNGEITFAFQSNHIRTKVNVFARYQIPSSLLNLLSETIIIKMNEREGAIIMDNLRLAIEHVKMQKLKPM